MADDMGFSDIGCFGGEIEKPHLDSLAKGGVRFTHFYSNARRCPTRASLMPTFLDASKTPYPATYKGVRIQPTEGFSLLPAFSGKDTLSKQTLYWEHEGNRAVRSANYKLVSKHPGGWELYDLAADRTELNDLSASKPELLAKLKVDCAEWAKRSNVEAWTKVQAAPKLGRETVLP